MEFNSNVTVKIESEATSDKESIVIKNGKQENETSQSEVQLQSTDCANINFKCKQEISNEYELGKTFKIENQHEGICSDTFNIDQNPHNIGEQHCEILEVEYMNFKCKEEMSNEYVPTCEEIKSENQYEVIYFDALNVDQNFQKDGDFSKSNDVDKNIDISNVILQYDENNLKFESETNSEEQRTVISKLSSHDSLQKQPKIKIEGGNVGSYERTSKKLKQQRTKLNCPFCIKSFTRKNTLDDHLLRHHKQEIKSNSKDIITSKIFSCKICSYETTRSSVFHAHINICHNKQKIICTFCNKSFTRKQGLEDHLLKQHKQKIKSDIKDYITSKMHTCKFCHYETTSKDLLNRHFDAMHNKQRMKINCSFCDKLFTKKQTHEDHLLKNHKREIQSNKGYFIKSKIHVCTICPYETTRNDLLYLHIDSVHNEQRAKTKCLFCDQEFIKKQTLDNHFLKKHKQEIENNMEEFITSKIYSCKLCPYETTRNYHLNTHINTVHNE